MPQYLIEFRFSGHAKKTMKELKQSISRNFGVSRRRIVPHITLVGPLHTEDEERLVREVVDACKRYKMVRFKIDGFDNFEDRVIYVKIRPSEELKKLRTDMAQRLRMFCTLSEFDFDGDHGDEFTFHATLVLKDIQRKFDRIWKYLQTWKMPETEQYVLRVTVLRHGRILAEYDLLQGKTLDRSKALDRKTHQKTIKRLYKKRGPPEMTFEDVTGEERVFVFSDTHFDHGNVIKKFVFRPFSSTAQMNEAMQRNWNEVVRDDDLLYFLGDMCYGVGRRPIDYWLGNLNGRVHFIRGNHDKDAITRATVISDRYGIGYRHHRFLLMHDPYRPFGYDGWIIHGDKHNNDLEKYPFISQRDRTVNACAEVVDYTPLDLDELVRMIETGRSYRTIDG